jgi:hypothetical protein
MARRIEFYDNPPPVPRQLGSLFSLRRDFCLRSRAAVDGRSAAEEAGIRRNAVWPDEKPFCLTLEDLTKEEDRFLTKRKTEKEFVDIARGLAKLGSALPMGERVQIVPPQPDAIRLAENYRAPHDWRFPPKQDRRRLRSRCEH